MIFLKTAIFTVLLPGAGTILFPYLLLQADILRLEIDWEFYGILDLHSF